jgi:hypothetical protein
LQDPDPELEVMDPTPGPELDLNLTKNHQKNYPYGSNFIIDIKNQGCGSGLDPDSE